MGISISRLLGNFICPPGQCFPTDILVFIAQRIKDPKIFSAFYGASKKLHHRAELRKIAQEYRKDQLYRLLTSHFDPVKTKDSYTFNSCIELAMSNNPGSNWKYYPYCRAYYTSSIDYDHVFYVMYGEWDELLSIWYNGKFNIKYGKYIREIKNIKFINNTLYITY